MSTTAPVALPRCFLLYQGGLISVGNESDMNYVIYLVFFFFTDLSSFCMFAASFPLLLVSTNSFIDLKENEIQI